VNFDDGSTYYYNVTSIHNARCVRFSSAGNSAPAGRYVTASGTVYDTMTKLTWQQTAPLTQYILTDARTYCADLGASLGGTAWRVPTMKELQTIVDDSRANPSIDPMSFPSAPVEFFWSSSPVAGFLGGAWVVDFKFGSTVNYEVSLSIDVRCVR
jgi:hypothetical protein